MRCPHGARGQCGRPPPSRNSPSARARGVLEHVDGLHRQLRQARLAAGGRSGGRVRTPRGSLQQPEQRHCSWPSRSRTEPRSRGMCSPPPETAPRRTRRSLPRALAEASSPQMTRGASRILRLVGEARRTPGSRKLTCLIHPSTQTLITLASSSAPSGCAPRPLLRSRLSGPCFAPASSASCFGGRWRSGGSSLTSRRCRLGSSSRSMAVITLGVVPPMRAAIGLSLAFAIASCGSRLRSSLSLRSRPSPAFVRLSRVSASRYLPHPRAARCARARLDAPTRVLGASRLRRGLPQRRARARPRERLTRCCARARARAARARGRRRRSASRRLGETGARSSNLIAQCSASPEYAGLSPWRTLRARRTRRSLPRPVAEASSCERQLAARHGSPLC
jgi:hypothetical protein